MRIQLKQPPSARWAHACRPFLVALPLLAVHPVFADYTASSGSIVTDPVALIGENAFIGGATLSGNVTLVSGNNTIFADAVANTVISGSISGAGNLIKSGASKLVLSGANTYAGSTTITNGVLEVASGGNLGSGPIVNNSLLTFSTNSAVTITGVSGVGSISVGGAGPLTLNGTNTMNGTVTLSRSSLTVSGNYSGSVVIPAGQSLTVNGSIGGATTTLANVTTTATGSLAALTLGANNTATVVGTTGAISMGANSTVTVNGGVGGNVSLGAGSFLNVTGNITGSLTLAASSVATLANTTVTGNTTLSTGSLKGTGSLRGTTTISSGGVYSTIGANFTFTNLSWVTNNSTAGIVFDLASSAPITINGAFNRSSTTPTNRYVIDFNGSSAEGTFVLVNYLTTNFTSGLDTLQATNLAAFRTASFSTANNKLYVTVVPEPSEYAAAFALFLGALIFLRHRAKRRPAYHN